MMLEKAQTPHGQALLRALLMAGEDAQVIAESCGVGQQLVLDWAIGKHRPDVVSRAILEKDYGIPATTWDLAACPRRS